MTFRKRSTAAIIILLFMLVALSPVMAAPARALVIETIEKLETVYTLGDDASVTVTESVTMSFSEETDKASYVITGLSGEPDAILVKMGSRTMVDRESEKYSYGLTSFWYKTDYERSTLTITCHFPKRTDGVTFSFVYDQDNALALYSDTALLDVRLNGDSTHDILQATATVVLPTPVDAEKVDVFWDDYKKSVISSTDGKAVAISLPEEFAGKRVDVQVAIPSSIFTEAPEGAVRQSEVLKDLQKERNDSLTYNKRKAVFAENGAMIRRLSVVLAILTGLLTRVRRRRHRPMSVRPSMAALPIGLSTMEFAEIMNFYDRLGKLSELKHSLHGTLMRLVDAGLVTVKPTAKKHGGFKLVYTPYDGCETFADENILLLLLFEDIGRGASEVTYKKIKNYARLLPGVVSGALRHMQEYSVNEMSERHNIEYFRFVKIPVEMLFQLVFALAAILFAYFGQWLTALVIFSGVFIIFVFGRDRLHRLSRSGEDIMARGKAFRRYVVQCAMKKQEGELPPLSWWQGVMGYVAAIGLVRYVQRQLPSLYPEMTSEEFKEKNADILPIFGQAIPKGGDVAKSLRVLSGRLARTVSVVSRNMTEK